MKRFLISAILLLGLAACQKQAPAPEPDDVAVRVGDTFVTQADVTARQKFLTDTEKQFIQTTVGRQNLVQIIAREKLIVADAKANQLDLDTDYQKALAAKRAELDEIYTDYADHLLERLWYQEQTKEHGKADVTEKEMKDYFAKYPYEMTIKQIIVDNAQTADQVLRTLKSNPSLWNSIARQHSIAPEELKTISFMPGEYLPNLEVIAANSPVGKVEGFFKTPQGFHIIMKTGEKRLTWQEAQPRIHQVLENQKIDQLLDSLKTKYEVIIYDKNE